MKKKRKLTKEEFSQSSITLISMQIYVKVDYLPRNAFLRHLRVYFIYITATAQICIFPGFHRYKTTVLKLLAKENFS